MRYAVAAEASEELPSRGLPWRNRPPELVPAGVVHALDVATEQVACGLPLAGLVPFIERDWERGISIFERDWERGVSIFNRRCPFCVQATGFGAAAE
jgi:hypothetical protein